MEPKKKITLKTNHKKTMQNVLLREEINKRLEFAANNNVETVLSNLGTTLNGLNEEQVDEKRYEFGDNIVIHEKEETILKKIWNSFVNPFTAILLVLSIVSFITDIVIPLNQNSPEDVNYITVIIILTMVIISGMLRFVQEIRSRQRCRKASCHDNYNNKYSTNRRRHKRNSYRRSSCRRHCPTCSRRHDSS